MANGKIGVSTHDLFPIIKKFLYSDHDIFLREIVSNAVDAVQKLKVVAKTDDFKGELGELKVNVVADKTKGTLTVSDNGIGMTAEEVDKYINQIAFSGAEEFLEKHKDDAATIIGHFGLGFYSAFMVSDRVEILTKSYKEGSRAVRWSCKGDPEYSLVEDERAEKGTDIILYINEEDKEFLEENKLKELLNKYCKFLPVPIVFGKKKEWKDGKEVETAEDNIINDTEPAWTRKPVDLKEEDYRNFYRTLYPMANDPLFHIHLNVDYPFNLTGILYFPKIDTKLELQRNKIQLYCNQVFVTDSVEGIVPDYLTLLHGVIDSVDIPLNVSRSYLQSDRNVKKISSHITKKVCDSLTDIFKDNRPDYEKKWDDLKVFIEYGMLTDEKFAERAKDIVLLKTTEDKYHTIEEFDNLVKSNQTDKDGNIVYLYATDKEEQYTYIENAKVRGYEVLMLDGQLDTHFIGYMEQKNEKHRILRVDSDVLDKLIAKDTSREIKFSEEERKDMQTIFDSQLPKGEAVFNVAFEALGAEEKPVMVTRSEFMRRMKEMAAMNPGMSFYGAMGDHFSLVINTDHPVIDRILQAEKTQLAATLDPIREAIKAEENKKAEIKDLNKDKKSEEMPQVDKDRIEECEKEISALEDKRKKVLGDFAKEHKPVGQLIDLALLANGLLKGEALSRFVNRSIEIIDK